MSSKTKNFQEYNQRIKTDLKKILDEQKRADPNFTLEIEEEKLTIKMRNLRWQQDHNIIVNHLVNQKAQMDEWFQEKLVEIETAYKEKFETQKKIFEDQN